MTVRRPRLRRFLLIQLISMPVAVGLLFGGLHLFRPRIDDRRATSGAGGDLRSPNHIAQTSAAAQGGSTSARRPAPRPNGAPVQSNPRALDAHGCTPLLGPCLTRIDCCSGYCLAGLCYDEVGSVCLRQSDCAPGAECMSNTPSGSTVCCLPSGDSCLTYGNLGCCSGKCDSITAICTTPSNCLTAADCCGGSCVRVATNRSACSLVGYEGSCKQQSDCCSGECDILLGQLSCRCSTVGTPCASDEDCCIGDACELHVCRLLRILSDPPIRPSSVRPGSL